MCTVSYRVAEWFKTAVFNTATHRKCIVGSNPTHSAQLFAGVVELADTLALEANDRPILRENGLAGPNPVTGIQRTLLLKTYLFIVVFQTFY